MGTVATINSTNINISKPSVNFITQIDTVGFKGKPTGTDIALLKPRLANEKPISCGIQYLEQAVLNGQTFNPGILQGGCKAEHWVSQQVFAIDIDNEKKGLPKGSPKQIADTPLSINEVLKRCTEWNIPPSLIYETFSSTEQWQKFRIVFICKELIHDGALRDNIQQGLQEIFPECDSSCINRDRLFFGGIRTLYIDTNASFETGNISALGTAIAQEKAFEEYAVKHRKSNNQTLDELKKSYDLLGLIRQSGSYEKRLGRLICFNPCPICGHNDDFFFYPETNSFKCFGANGDVGGTVIDYIMHTQNSNVKEAIRYFKYELCGINSKEEKAILHKNIITEHTEQDKLSNAEQVELPPYIFEKINERTGEVKLSVSCPLLAKFIRDNCNYMFAKEAGRSHANIYWYDRGCYRLINEEMLKGYIKGYITAVSETLLRMADVREVFQNLMSDLKYTDYSLLNANENIVNFQNGLLYLDTMELKPHTPDILSTIQIPCNWNENATNAPVFNAYMDKLTNGDKEKRTLLLQFIGMALSNVKGYRPKKSLFMVGSGDTGKSQLKALTEKLLGAGNYTAIDLSELEGRFGTSNLFGKRLAGASDMSFMSVMELKNFKKITGGDQIFAEFKGRDGFQFVYDGLLWFCMNKLPKFGGDRGEWVYDRIIVMECNNVIPKAEQDRMLLDKMYAEREAIVNMAIKELWNVVFVNGYAFSVPNSCTSDNMEYRKENNPVHLFYEECCVIRDTNPKDSCTTKKMYDVFKAWCSDNNYGYAISNREFKREIASLLNVDVKELTVRTNKNTYYVFTLNIESKKNYVRVYGFDDISDYSP